MAQRRGGIIYLTINGEKYDAKGNFEYNLGRNMREAIVGSDGIHDYKETPQVAFIAGEITDRNELDLNALVIAKDVSVMLELANGKIISLANAWFASEGTGNSEEGNIAVRFEGPYAEEIN